MTITGFKILFTAAGTAVVGFLGGWDTVLYALLMFMALDYLTGFIATAVKKQLNSSAGFTGLLRKAAILLVVALAVLLDRLLNLGEPWIRTAACWFYIANEGISVFENLGLIGIPIPGFLKNMLQQLNDQAETKANREV